MTKYYAAKIQLNDAKDDNKRRYRNILAASGKILESGEIRDLEHLYVMGHDSELYRIHDLAKNPDTQKEVYAVKAQADHGELVDGELIPSIEKQFGSCKVWLEDDGLHARMYFANNDALADHAWAISEDASYSTGIDWYPDGYYGAGQEMDEAIGILREISMVLTGNDPRAKTIDTKSGKGSTGAAVGDNKSNKKGKTMPTQTKSLDSLDQDERAGMMREMSEAIDSIIDKYTDGDSADAGTTDTTTKGNDTKDNTDESKKSSEDDGAADKTTDGKSYDAYMADTKKVHRSNIFVIKDRKEKAQQYTGSVSTVDTYLKSEKAVAAWGRALMDSKGDPKAWRDNFRKEAKRDGVNFGEDVSLAPELLIKEVQKQLDDQDSILAHVTKTGLAYEMVAIPTSEDGGNGHKNGQKKVEENITGTTRVFVPADIYKLMKLDHSMVKINGGISSSAIVKYVLGELPRKLVETIDQGILVGGIKNEDNTDFTALNPIITDITTTGSIYGSVYTAAAGDNLRATLSKAAARVRSGYSRYLIAPADLVVDIENATTSGGQLLFPNGINKENPNLSGIKRILTPLWLTKELLGGLDAVIVDLPAYHTVGDTSPENFSDYDIDYNKYVWEAVSCIGGGLANKNAAVGLKLNAAAAASTK